MKGKYYDTYKVLATNYAPKSFIFTLAGKGIFIRGGIFSRKRGLRIFWREENPLLGTKNLGIEGRTLRTVYVHVKMKRDK